ncbi:hypothetical protein RhiirA1_452583 [Rhizophagus irregularis]|uniref:Uncharacterized protein n=1 Tax=Rhizophagus irregularis TaxID=588596 RepID=A0A2N0S9I8_9GLOM|nr:hypothetical protein RhiirA1_452583 [Rhizophagus irregularis]
MDKKRAERRHMFKKFVNIIEEVNDNFYKNPIKKNKINQLNIFNAKFTLNNVPCELEYDLSKILQQQ